MIILNALQAEHVRTGSKDGGRLAPVPLTNGTEWVLPEQVCADPKHKAHHALLAILPTREVSQDEYPKDDGE